MRSPNHFLSTSGKTQSPRLRLGTLTQKLWIITVSWCFCLKIKPNLCGNLINVGLHFTGSRTVSLFGVCPLFLHKLIHTFKKKVLFQPGRWPGLTDKLVAQAKSHHKSHGQGRQIWPFSSNTDWGLTEVPTQPLLQLLVMVSIHKKAVTTQAACQAPSAHQDLSAPAVSQC